MALSARVCSVAVHKASADLVLCTINRVLFHGGATSFVRGAHAVARKSYHVA